MTTKSKTTISLSPEVAKALKYYLADTEQSFRDQSKVINDLILRGLVVARNEMVEQGNSKAPCPA
jgi:hypothetical protein